MAARGARQREGVEVGRLDDHRRGGTRQLAGGAPHHTGEPDRAGVVGDDQVGRVERAHDVVERGQLLPRLGLPDHDRPVQLVGVVGVQGLPGLEHHVVGDVDGQRDGAHPGQLHPARQPARAGPVGVEAGDRDRDEERAGRRREPDGVAGVRRVRHGTVDGVGERDALGLGGLAGQTAQGHAVAAVGGDVDVEHRVAQEQHGCGVLSGLELGGVVQDDDAVVVVPEAELAGRADHPVGHVPVGLAGSDAEVAGQHGTGQGHDHEVAGAEVVGAADDPAGGRLGRGGGLVPVADVDAAPVDGLAVGVLLGLDRQHPPDHHRPGDVGAGLLDGLDLEPDPDEGLGEVPSAQVARQRRVLGEPAERGPHRAAPTRERLKRTSPSIMSRMSSAPLRNIRVRSTPMPKAKPE